MTDKKEDSKKKNMQKQGVIGTIVAVILLLIILGIYQFFNNADAGINAPENFTEYSDSEEYLFSYPENYEVEGFGSFAVVNPGDGNGFASLQLSISSIDDLEDDTSNEGAYEALVDGNCKGYFTKSVEGAEEDGEYTIELDNAKEISIHGNKGCEFNFSTSGESEDKIKNKSYLVMNDEDAVFLTVTQLIEPFDDEDKANFVSNDAEEQFILLDQSARTFMFK